jgi:Response regulator containing CheY-like receiver, AAA-type ATPase, and DNA-binding domains
MRDIPSLVLVVDDEPIARKNLAHVLGRMGCQVSQADDGRQALAELEKNEFDLVLTDLMMEGVDGLAVLKRTKELWPDTEVLVVTGYPTVETAVEAMRRGAYHYLAKPYQIEEARLLVQKALEKRRLRQEVRELRERMRERSEPLPIIGDSPPVRRLKQAIAQVAAHGFHRAHSGRNRDRQGTGGPHPASLSRRAEARFLAINCGAFNEDLLENELFGHEAGAFSGAQRMKKGLFESAPGGTLFLDEMGEMSMPMQVKLLRAIQERVIRRVGGTDDVPVDVRLVAATNRDLKHEVEAGRFRQDLYYRLNVITLLVPPLSERLEDIPLLCQFFLAKAARMMDKPQPTLAPDVPKILSRYAFPGNVRELENILERAVILAEDGVVEPRHLPEDLRETAVRVARPGFSEPMTLEENEKRYIAWVLKQAGGTAPRRPASWASTGPRSGARSRSSTWRIRQGRLDLKTRDDACPSGGGSIFPP